MAAPALIPQEVLFGSTETTSPMVSPDARLLAFVGPVDEVANLFVRDLAGGDATQLTHDTGRGIHTFRWAGDSRHLLFEQDSGGDENSRLIALDATDAAVRELVALPGVRAQVLGVDPALPDIVCVAMNRDDPAWADLYHVSISTGEIVQVAKNDGFSRWALGAGLQALGAVRPLATGGAEVVVRANPDEAWRTVLTLSSDDAFHATFDVFPMWLAADGQTAFFVTAAGRDTAQLVALDVTSGDLTTVAGTARGEVTWRHELDPVTRTPQLIGVAEERARYIAVDPSYAADLVALAGLDDGDPDIVSRDAADEIWTVEFLRDRGSRAYYLYRRSTRTGELLFHASPELEQYELAAMEPASFMARDGLEIPVYLTFPPGLPRALLPTVVMIHGGPAGREYWGMSPMAQLFANRGYLVVQVNFRGSLGYGKAFFRAGDRQWARAMHADIVDTIEWVTTQGWTDRSRVGLWGTSYGGYETLVAVTHDPDLVACAVPVVAPVNLISLLASIPAYWQAEREYFLRVLGDDEDELWERSPLRLAHQVKVPLLLFYGEKDPRVTVAEAHQLAEAFDQAGVAYDMHIIPDEGHSLGSAMSPEHRADYVGRIERFFARHLGGRTS